MDYESLILSRDALSMILELPELPVEDRSRVELAIATIDVNNNMQEQNKRLIGRDQNGELVFKN